jgi:hypothetical protein
MSVTKIIVNLVLLFLVLACAINQTMCIHCNDPTDFVRAAKCPNPFLATATDVPIDSFHQRLYAFLTVLGLVVKACLGSVLMIFKYFVFLICGSAFGGLFIVGLDALWRWYHGAAKSNVPFYIPPATTTSTADSAPVFMPLPATTRPATQPTFADQIPMHARICLVLATPLFFVLGLLIVGLVGVTAFLGAVQHGYVLLRESVGAVKAKIGTKIRRSFTSVTFLCAITVAMVFSNYSSITLTSRKHRLTLRIKPATTKKRERCITQRRPSLALSSSTIGAIIRTHVEEILRPTLTTTIETRATTTSITTDVPTTNMAPLLRTPMINNTVTSRPSTLSLLSSNSNSTRCIVPSTTVEAERLRSETATRAAHGSFMDRIDIQEEEESKRDDYIPTSVPVHGVLVDPAVAPHRKVNKLVKLGNFVKKVFKGKPKPLVPVSMDGISDFEVPACEEASRKGSFFKKVFERKLSSSTSSTLSASSSSPNKHRSPSSSFSVGSSFTQFGETAY